MFKKFLILMVMGVLSGCSLNKHPMLWTGGSDSETAGSKTPTVAVLLPLSGESEKVGDSMQKAAMMATFEHKETPLKVLFFDTESSAAGAEKSYLWALAQKPDLVVGPVFSKEVQAIKSSGVSVPLLSFTSDTKLVDDEVGTMAITVAEQVRQMVRHACSFGQMRLAVLGPDSKTGEIAMNALSDAVRACPGMTIKKVSLYDANTTNFTPAVQQIVPPLINTKKKELTEAEKQELAKPMSERAGVDAIILFEEGVKLRQLLSLLAFYDAGPKDIPVYGLTVVKQINDNNANFVYYADVDDTNYQNFARQYKAEFGQNPVRIASQMYDVMGFVFHETAARRGITLNDLRKQNSYWGVDGLVRLNPDGTNRRSLLLKQKRGSRQALIEPAESFFDDEENVLPENDFNQPTTESID